MSEKSEHAEYYRNQYGNGGGTMPTAEVIGFDKDARDQVLVHVRWNTGDGDRQCSYISKDGLEVVDDIGVSLALYFLFSLIE